MLYMIFCKSSCVNSIPPRFITLTDEQLLRSRRWIGARKKRGFYYLCEAKPPALAGSAPISLQAAVCSASALKLEQPSTMYLAT